MADTNFRQDRSIEARKPMPAKFFNEDQHVRPASVLISRPVEEVWAFIRDLTNMPRFIRGLREVRVQSPKLSHWVFENEGEKHEYDSEIIGEELNSLFAWRTLGDRQIIGCVTLEPAPVGRGTFVSMRTSSDREHGKVVGVLSWYIGGDPKSASYVNLRRLKAYIETGEVPTVEGQPNGREQEIKH